MHFEEARDCLCSQRVILHEEDVDLVGQRFTEGSVSASPNP
jgi:hypothetical protein